MALGRKGRGNRRRCRVRDDWIAWLPPEKLQVFEEVVRGWEIYYGMLSVALDEALSLRSDSRLAYARQQAANSAELFDRLSVPLLAALEAIRDHGRHFGTLSSVSPLDPGFFRGENPQRTAAWNNLLHHVLLSDRSRFFHKLRALAGIIEDLTNDFHETAECLAENLTTMPEAEWEALECLHYDLNTCLREAVVVFKCFLRAIPTGELSGFQESMAASARSAARRTSHLTRVPT